MNYISIKLAYKILDINDMIKLLKQWGQKEKAAHVWTPRQMWVQNQLDPSFCGSLAFGLSSAEDVGEEEGPKT